MSGKLKTGKKVRFYVLLIIVIIIVFGGIYGLKWYQGVKAAQIAASMPKQYQTISSVTSKTGSWYNHAQSVATIRAVNGVDINAQVSGKILKIFFKSGEYVQKGQDIVQLEDFAEVQQLNNYIATMKINKITMERQYHVYRAGLIAKETYDEAKAAYEEAQANVKMEQANIAYKHVKAPFAGQIGINHLNLGQYVSAGTKLANLQTLQPIYGDFELPEQFFNTTHKGQVVHINLPSMPGQVFTGKVLAKSASVDTTTRNFSIEAVFANKEKLLKPGMFANSDLRIGQKQQVVLVPRTAVVYSLYGNQIYTLAPAGSDKQGKLYKIKGIPADLGEVVGTDIIVKSGLKAGVPVVATGQLKVVNGMTVRVNDAVKLAPMAKNKLKGQ
jgi:membrane fusion protein (multidrug efflux system)